MRSAALLLLLCATASAVSFTGDMLECMGGACEVEPQQVWCSHVQGYWLCAALLPHSYRLGAYSVGCEDTCTLRYTVVRVYSNFDSADRAMLHLGLACCLLNVLLHAKAVIDMYKKPAARAEKAGLTEPLLA